MREHANELAGTRWRDSFTAFTTQLPLMKSYDVLSAMFNQGLPESTSHAIALCETLQGESRWQAVSRLGFRHPDSELVAFLRRCLQSDERVMRTGALAALARRPVRELANLVAECLTHDNFNVILWALGAASAYRASSMCAFIRPHLNSSYRELRAAAAEASGSAGCSDIIPDLHRLLTDESDEVRYCAVDALGKLGSRESSEFIRSRLKDQDRGVREVAARVLRQWEGANGSWS
jgi:hypothetical protein